MKIKMLTSMAGADESTQCGDIIDKPETIALAWIEAGIAEAVPGEKVEPQAKPAKAKK